MQLKEFETLSGISVSAEEYAGIERAYMAAGEVDKRTFCAEWKVIGGAETVRAMAARAAALEAQLVNACREVERLNELVKRQTGLITDLRNTADNLGKEVKELTADKFTLTVALLEAGRYEQARQLLGQTYVVGVKCSANLELTQDDRRFIAGVLQGRKRNG